MSQISYIPPMIKNFKNVKDDRRIKSQTVCGSVNAGSTNQPCDSRQATLCFSFLLCNGNDNKTCLLRGMHIYA